MSTSVFLEAVLGRRPMAGGVDGVDVVDSVDGVGGVDGVGSVNGEAVLTMRLCREPL